MKDEYDKSTIDLVDSVLERPHHVPQGRGAGTGAERSSEAPPPYEVKKSRPKRLTNQSSLRPPEGAKPEFQGAPLGFGRSVLPVSAAAKDWGVSTRRIRTMLSTGRLNGRRLDNGYWEVYYPYCYTFGTRGPVVKRQQRQLAKPKKPEFPEHSPEWSA